MNLLTSGKQQLRKLVMGYRFMQLVNAPYGDFSKIGQLSQASNDDDSIQLVIDFLSSYPQGKNALKKQPLLGNIDLAELHQLPENTVGYAYADHMLRNGFTPPPAQEITQDNFSFIHAHLFETHDIWHVVTGCPTTKAGEIKLEAFCAAQIYPARFWLAMLAKNLLKTALEDIELCSDHLDALTQGWLLGKQAEPLFGLEWNTLWKTPLDQLRIQLNLNPRMQSQVEVN